MANVGFNCHNHLATDIRSREPVLCRRWIPGFATHCPDCDAPADRISVHALLGASRGGNVEKTEAKNYNQPRQSKPVVPSAERQKRSYVRLGPVLCSVCDSPGHNARTCDKRKSA